MILKFVVWTVLYTFLVVFAARADNIWFFFIYTGTALYFINYFLSKLRDFSNSKEVQHLEIQLDTALDENARLYKANVQRVKEILNLKKRLKVKYND